MDEDAFARCLHHLEQAEKLMIEEVDGMHLARLSLVVEYLKEAYGPRQTAPTVTAVQ